MGKMKSCMKTQGQIKLTMETETCETTQEGIRPTKKFET